MDGHLHTNPFSSIDRWSFGKRTQIIVAGSLVADRVALIATIMMTIVIVISMKITGGPMLIVVIDYPPISVIVPVLFTDVLLPGVPSCGLP